jgi:hypothetical protein
MVHAVLTTNPSSRTVEAPSKRRYRVLVFSVIALFFGTSVSLLLAEFAVRLFNPQTLTSDVVEWDPDVDYRLRPNARGRMVSPEFSAEIRVNSLGFRGPEISPAKKPGVRRVLFLGDSFVFGAGLKEHETLPYAVSRELERRHVGDFEVINGGVYGYQTVNELEFFTKFGVPLHPDIVVILVMTHDMVQNTDWYEWTGDGQLKKKPFTSQYMQSRAITRLMPGASWLREHSHLFKFVGMRILPTVNAGENPVPEHTGGSPKSNPQPVRHDQFSPEFYQEERGAFRVTTELLTRLVDVAKENGAKCVLLTLGGTADQNMAESLSPREMLPHEQLIAAGLRVGFSDALALPSILAGYRGNENLFFPKDRHWTATATSFVAPAVADAILRASGQDHP